MKRWGALAGFLFGCAAFASAEQTHRILLVPVDDRPAVSHFAEMIGDIAGVTVETPPVSLLGRFKQPGRPEQIIGWMAQQDLTQYDAVVLSADMIAYGGLIASRTDRSSENLAKIRLRELWKVRKSANQTPFYVFSTLTRIAPTAVAENREWRQDLANWAVYNEQASLYGDPEARRKAMSINQRFPLPSSIDMSRCVRATLRSKLS